MSALQSISDTLQRNGLPRLLETVQEYQAAPSARPASQSCMEGSHERPPAIFICKEFFDKPPLELSNLHDLALEEFLWKNGRS
jgi:hypothetical protein